jgi:Family of unknown function (DUF6528)
MSQMNGAQVNRVATGLLALSLTLAAGACKKAEKDGVALEKDSSITQTEELILCGWDEVFILKMSTSETAPQKVWSWRAEGRQDLPDSMKSRFASTDECKPVDGGAKILITSSSNGVALVERDGGKVLFYGVALNAHSADMIPSNRIAVAASHSSDGNGDRLIVFDLNSPGRELCSVELSWGHGVVWDEERQILWALSGEDIRAYKLKDWETPNPHLERAATFELPEGDGHDLYPVPGTAWLSVSTGHHCWLFDRDRHNFIPHPELADHARVKSIAVNPLTGRMAWVEAEGDNWWAERVHFLNPGNTLYMPGEHFYKARWNTCPDNTSN